LAVGQPLNLLSELGRKAVSTVEFTDWPARGGEHFEDGVASPEPCALVAAGESAWRCAAAEIGGREITQGWRFPEKSEWTWLVPGIRKATAAMQ
jgi:hypothetical protein